VGWDGDSSRFDLGQREQIFFGKSERKDSTPNGPTGKSPHGRDFICAAQAGAYPAVRCFIQ
jgi:hypothetical protein